MKIKSLYIIIAALSIHLQSIGQKSKKFVGNWEGKLNVGIELRIVIHIKANGDSVSSTLDSPDQNAFGFVANKTTITGNELYFEIRNLNASFTGKIENDSIISGIFKQNADFELTLKKTNTLAAPPRRPQTPQPPFPYRSEDIEYDNANKDLHYGATITIPEGKGPFPAAVMITGSGAQNRDEEILGHKLFAVIADHLTRNGFIVLRVDDREIGKSTGDFKSATSEDFVKDVNTSLNYLLSRSETDKKRVGLIGHSEGGMIAPMVASQRKDIDFIILLAGPGEKIIDLMAEQNAAILRSSGISDTAIQQFIPAYRSIITAVITAKDSANAKLNAKAELAGWNKTASESVIKEMGFTAAESQTKYIDAIVPVLYSPWFRYFLSFDPVPYLEKLKCKVLALNGDKDLQIISKSNLAGIERALKKSQSKKYEVKELSGLNHLFQHCKKCSLSEYGSLEETISPEVLEIMAEWLKKNIK
jgi:alpha/beta superfamily hydrolase